MMNAKKAAWLVVAFLFCIAVVGILRSCVIVRTAVSQARLKLLLASLPEPENAVVLDDVAGVGGGSDSNCYTAYVHRQCGLGYQREMLARLGTLVNAVSRETRIHPLSLRFAHKGQV